MDGRKTPIQTSHFGLFVLFLISITACKCDDDKSIEYVDIILMLDFKVTPIADTFHLGDTIWLTLDSPDTLLDYNSKKYFKIENFDFKSRVGIISLVNKNIYISEQPGALGDFTLFSKKGLLSNPRDTFADLATVYSEDSYQCKIAFIPNKKGLFCVEFLSPEYLDLSLIKLDKSSEGRRKIPVYRGLFYSINMGVNNNFDLLEANSKLTSITYPIPENIYAEQKGTFTFQVVE